MAHGEYEPKDSRNVTGTATTPDGRWTNTEATPPLANGEHPVPPPHDELEEDDDEPIEFEPAPELLRRIHARRSH